LRTEETALASQTQALTDALAADPAAALVWEQLPPEQQHRLGDHIAKARTDHGRRRRAREMTDVLTSEGAKGVDMWLASPRGWEELAAMESGVIPSGE
jgi:uncharacterized protein YdeI (YjbR/CyaY-like superfamily)